MGRRFRPDWNTAASWSSDPANPTGNFFVNTASVGVLPIISATSVFNPIDIFVGNGANTGRLDHTAGTVSTGAGNWMYIGTGGGTGTYNLANTAAAGGTHTGHGTGSGSATASGRLLIGIGTNSVGTVNVNTSGSLAIGGGGLFVADQFPTGAVTGNLNIDSGAVTVAGGETFFGSGGNASGNFKIGEAGSLTTAGQIHFGQWGGTGSGTQTGGTVTANGIFILAGIDSGDVASTGTGSYIMSGGSLDVNSQLWVGQRGNGALTQSAGSVSTDSWLVIGRSSGGTGIYNLSGGTMDATAIEGNVIIGESGKGTLTVGGSGVFNAQGTGNVSVGQNGGSTGVVNLAWEEHCRPPTFTEVPGAAPSTSTGAS